MLARRISVIAAPAFLFAYGVCRLLDGQQGFYGPGIYWTMGHLFFIAAFIAFGFAAWEFEALAGDGNKRRLAIAAALLTTIGTMVFIRVGGIDLATGLLAANHDAMASISAKLNGWPDKRLLPWWQIGPILFQVGLMSLLILLVIARRLPWWSPVIVLLGFIAIAYNLNLLAVGAVLIGAGFFPVVRDTRPA